MYILYCRITSPLFDLDDTFIVGNDVDQKWYIFFEISQLYFHVRTYVSKWFPLLITSHHTNKSTHRLASLSIM